jgi:hypothetical protein
LLPSPLAGFPLLPFVAPSTYLAPSSCDRNRPPPSQVACKLTPFAPPFTQLTHPPQILRTPPAPRLTMTTSGIFRLLLSGTVKAHPGVVDAHSGRVEARFGAIEALPGVTEAHPGAIEAHLGGDEADSNLQNKKGMKSAEISC